MNAHSPRLWEKQRAPLGPTVLAMDQRSQAWSVAGRSAVVERMLTILEPQHGERAAGDQRRLNEQQAIADMMLMLRQQMRMLGDEEPPQGATSKAAPPRPPAQQPPQPQCPQGHGLVDFRPKTDKYTCDACQERIPKAYVAKACRECNYDLCQKCAGAPAALGRQQSGEGQRPRRRRTRRRSHDKNHQELPSEPSGTKEEAETEDEEREEEEEEQREEGEVGQQVEGPRAQPRPQIVASTNVTGSDGFGEGDGRNDAFAGDSGKDPSGAQHSEGIGSSDGTHASGTKMLCDVEGLDMIWRNGQAELQLPAGAPGDASKQVPANTRLCLLGSIGGGGGPSLVPAKARPEGYEGPVFEFELNAKSMIVTDDSAKPMKLAQWWLDLPNPAGDNAGAVWWHNAALDGDYFTIATVANPPTIFFKDNSLPMHFAPGFKTLWSLQWDEGRKCYMPY